MIQDNLARGFNVPEIQALFAGLLLALRVGDSETEKQIRDVFAEHGVQLIETPNGLRWTANPEDLT